MDMPISQINARLFSRLPNDLGLGLLFATGSVSQVVYASGDRPIQFMLRHAGYALRCKLAPGIDSGFRLADGQIIRATGHLSFSSQSAQFHLFVRDLELLKDTHETGAVGTADLQDLTKSPTAAQSNPGLLSQPVKLALGEIPDWVFALAPDEVRTNDFRWGTDRVQAALQQKIAVDSADQFRLDQNEKLLAFLLESLEKSEHQDIVLTSEILEQFQTDVLSGGLSPGNNRLNNIEQARPEMIGADLAQLSSGPWLFLAILFLLAGAVLISLYLLAHFGIL